MSMGYGGIIGSNLSQKTGPMNTEQLNRIERKLDILLNVDENKINQKKYLTAKDVQDLTGLDHRTILNRSNLPPGNKRFIPSVQFNSRRKYFERTVIERIFKIS